MSKWLWITITTLLLGWNAAQADLNMVREVVIAPKNGRVAANIGSVNRTSSVRMVRATVDIEVGRVPASSRSPVKIGVRAVFEMKNESLDSLSLTVGFPISHSEYSAFDLTSFSVETDGHPRSVFNRISGYPRRINHTFVSGPSPEGVEALDDFSQPGTPLKLFGEQKIGTRGYQNLMVWQEVFGPEQAQVVDVRYVIDIPPQKNAWRKKMVKGNYKGIWPQEANNLPIEFLKSIPAGQTFYFFDYYLVSGASWKGNIGEETITLRLDKSWQGLGLYSNMKEKLLSSSEQRPGAGKAGLTYVYVLRDVEPAENLYFALKRPAD